MTDIDSGFDISMEKPQGWEVEPDEFLGRDRAGREYYLLENNVYRVAYGFTAWLGTLAWWGISNKIILNLTTNY